MMTGDCHVRFCNKGAGQPEIETRSRKEKQKGEKQRKLREKP